MEDTEKQVDKAVEESSAIRDAIEALGGDYGGGAGIINGAGKIYEGVQSMRDGEYGEGLYDIATGTGTGVKGGMDALKVFGVGGGAGKVGRGIDIASGLAGIGHGIHDIATDEGYGGQTLDGIHDILAGGADMASGIGGENSQLGAIGKGLGIGIKAGDALAPFFFNDAESKGTQTQAIPEGGFTAKTGNDAIDDVIGGARSMSDGDVLGGLYGMGKGVLGGGLMLDPVSMIATGTINGAIDGLFDDDD